MEKTSLFSEKLPFFSLISGEVFNLLNHWYQDAPAWWAMVIGLPLMILSFSIFAAALSAVAQSIFSQEYNRSHCPFCQRPVRIKSNHRYLD